MRSVLNCLYSGAGVLAGVFLVLMTVLVAAQIAGRFVGVLVPSAGDFAGYLMAASAFLGAAYTLRHNGHVRVELVIDWLPFSVRQWIEKGLLAVAAVLIGYFAWHSGLMAWDSFEFNEQTHGLLPIPLWIPQLGMVLGLALLAIAFADDFVVMCCGADASYDSRMTEDGSASSGHE